MFSPILFTIFVVSVTAWEMVPTRHQVDWETPDQDLYAPQRELDPDFYEYLHQNLHRRQTRQLHGSTFVNSDRTSGEFFLISMLMFFFFKSVQRP